MIVQYDQSGRTLAFTCFYLYIELNRQKKIDENFVRFYDDAVCDESNVKSRLVQWLRCRSLFHWKRKERTSRRRKFFLFSSSEFGKIPNFFGEERNPKEKQKKNVSFFFFSRFDRFFRRNENPWLFSLVFFYWQKTWKIFILFCFLSVLVFSLFA